jgi:Flp pilus assembly protein TadG
MNTFSFVERLFVNYLTPKKRSKSLLSGQALIELAFLLPLLVGLAIGVIELGRYAYIGILVGNAARAGSAFGAQSIPQSTDTTGISNAAKFDFAGAASGPTAKNGLQPATLTVISSIACGCDNAGTVNGVGCNAPGAGKCVTGHWVITLTVTASGMFNGLFSDPGIPGSISVSRASSVRVAQN